MNEKCYSFVVKESCNQVSVFGDNNTCVGSAEDHNVQCWFSALKRYGARLRHLNLALAYVNQWKIALGEVLPISGVP